MRQLSRQEAVDLAESREWMRWTTKEKCLFQLYQDRICMPLGIFIGAVEEVLGRPVWTHEFADRESLIRESLGEEYPKSLEDVIDKLLDHLKNSVTVAGE